MFNFFRAAVSALRPAYDTTLPSIVAALDEVSQATGASTQRTLEQTEILTGCTGRLAEILTRLEAHVSTEPEGRAAWAEAVQACLAMAPAVAAIVAAMEFRDPAGHRLRDALDSAGTLRARFREVLAMVNAQTAPEPPAPPTAPSPFRAPAPRS